MQATEYADIRYVMHTNYFTRHMLLTYSKQTYVNLQVHLWLVEPILEREVDQLLKGFFVEELNLTWYTVALVVWDSVIATMEEM